MTRNQFNRALALARMLGVTLDDALHHGADPERIYTPSKEGALAFIGAVEGPAVIVPHRGSPWALIKAEFHSLDGCRFALTSKTAALRQQKLGWAEVTSPLIDQAFGDES